MAQAHFTWGPSEVSSEQFVQTVNAAYSEIVHWRRNVFSVPSGKAGKAFVSELARLFRSYADGSAFESIALTAAMILSQLLLQKPSTKSKAHEHLKCLAWHLEIWKAGDILSLLEEGRAIQSRLLVAKPRPSASNQEHTARAFAKLMFQGRVKAALRLITEQSGGGILQLDSCVSGSPNNAPLTVHDVLLSKHPSGQPVSANALYDTTTEPPIVHPVVFEAMDATAIKRAALHTDGAAGPSVRWPWRSRYAMMEIRR